MAQFLSATFDLTRLAGFGIAAATAAGAIIHFRIERSARHAADAACAASREEAAGAVRLLRLAAGEMRGIALTLLGHAQAQLGPERVVGEAQPSSGDAIAVAAHRLIGISEDMLRASEGPDGARRLEEEVVDIGPVLEFAVAQVAAGLGPGRRAWRMLCMQEDARLFVDKRALNQILVNVLSGAAASTRDGDWIDITLHQSDEEWRLQIEDEGAGLPVASQGGPGHENRGIGYGLTLARSLMHAHGGRLEVESAARVGTRVCLIFPVSRARITSAYSRRSEAHEDEAVAMPARVLLQT